MKKRTAALLLSVLLVVCVFAGCDRSGDTDTVGPNSGDSGNKSHYAYQAVISAISNDIMDGYKLSNINSFCVSGNTAYMTADFISEDKQKDSNYIDPASAEQYEDDSAYCTTLVAVDLTTGNIICTDYSQSVLPEGTEGSYSLSELSAGPDGTVWVIETVETYKFDLPADFDETADSKWSYYSPAESIVNILQYGPDGKQVSANPVHIEGEIGSYFNFMADHSGNLYCTDLSNIFVYSKDGALLCTLSYDNGYLIQLGTYGIGLLTFDLTGNSVIKSIDVASASYAPDLILDNGTIIPQIGNKSYIYTYISNGKIFGVEQTTEETVQILDFLSCDINDNRITDYSILDEGTVAALQKRTIPGEDDRYDLVVLAMTDISSLPEKKIITLACEYVNDNIKDHIIRFNQTNDRVRVQLVDAYDDENSSDMIMTDLIPLASYAAEGKLIDLLPFIEQDEALSTDDLMSSVFDAASINGKLYEAASSFIIHSAAGKKDFVGTTRNWDNHELVQATSHLTDNGTIFGSENAADTFLNNFVYQTLDQYVDWEKAAADFDSDAFVGVLEFVKILSEEGSVAAETNDKKNNEYNRLYTSTQLLTVNQVDSFDQIKYANAMHRGEVGFVGYPTSTNSGNLFEFIDPIAITAECSDPDAAWTFVRTFLTEDYQSSQNLNGFPTNKHAFERFAAFEMEPKYETDAAGNKTEVSSGTIRLEGILTLELFAVTEGEYNQFMDLYHNCNAMSRSNAFLTELIRPEINAMLADNFVSAADVAAQINVIVNEYLSSDIS